jgi:hypothetical protein
MFMNSGVKICIPGTKIFENTVMPSVTAAQFPQKPKLITKSILLSLPTKTENTVVVDSVAYNNKTAERKFDGKLVKKLT